MKYEQKSIWKQYALTALPLPSAESLWLSVCFVPMFLRLCLQFRRGTASPLIIS